MRYSIAEAKDLCERWHKAQALMRVIFSDVATGGVFSGLIRSISDAPPTAFSVEMEVLLVNGVRGSSLITVNFWGMDGEEVDFSDFTDEPSPMVSADDLDNFNSCLSIKYENGSMLTMCEIWPSPAVETLRGSCIPPSQFETMLRLFNEHKNET